MADFKQWALQYVLEDDESALNDFAQRAAERIRNNRANTATIGSWASSIQEWMSGADDNIIARAKALGFLAATVRYLDPSLLRVDQVQFLSAFFGSMFSHDHKAGIEASTQALRFLRGMKKFNAEIGVRMLEDVLRIQEDFSKQTPTTRREIYGLLLSIIEDSSVRRQLGQKYGEEAGYAVDLIRMCQRERDPQNLLIWFGILRVLVGTCLLSQPVTEQVFQAFANYFPISLNKHAAPIGVTTEDLKTALRECFASHLRLAPLAFSFLLERLDRGDAVIAEVEAVSIKLDILRTLEACIRRYEDPQTSIVPHVEKIWTSLKFEVRHGEVKERIDATLQVLRAVAVKLDSSAVPGLESSHLSDYLGLVYKDCRNDLSNPMYAKQAGLLWVTVLTANVQALLLQMPQLIQELRQDIRKSTSSSHKKDLFSILNVALDGRQKLIGKSGARPSADQSGLQRESTAHLEDIWVQDLAPLLTQGKDTQSDDVLSEAFRVVAQLCSQQSLREDGTLVQSIPRDIYVSICEALSHHLFSRLAREHFDSDFEEVFSPAVDSEALVAARTVVTYYREGFEMLLVTATSHLQSWPMEHRKLALDFMKEAIARLAFIGGSEIPKETVVEPPSDQPPRDYFALRHLLPLVGKLIDLAGQYTQKRNFFSVPEANFIVVSGIYASLLQFRDCCRQRFDQSTLLEYSKGGDDWTREFREMNSGPDEYRKIVLLRLPEEDPELYRQFLRVGLFAAWELCRSVQLTPGPKPGNHTLDQIAALTAFAVRNLDQSIQRACSLANHAQRCFLSEIEFTHGGALDTEGRDVLMRGILEGLWPEAMTDLYEPNGLAESLLCDLTPFARQPSRVAQTRAVIGAILANKYRGQQSTANDGSNTMKNAISFWANYLQEAVISNSAGRDDFQGAHTMAMHVLAGASARQDKIILDIVPVLHKAIGTESTRAETVTRSMGILVRDMDFLNSENHARVSKLRKQWTYNYFFKPLYARALPNAKGPAAVRYAVAILSAVEHCQFPAYQDDLEALNRLIITILSTRTASSEAASALAVLHVVLENEPNSLGEHVQTVITGVVGTYQAARREMPNARDMASSQRTELVKCRRQALLILCAIPSKFEQDILPHAPEVQRLLATASADAVRELRKLALVAREAWDKLA